MHNASATSPFRANTIALFPWGWEVLSASVLGDRVFAEMRDAEVARRAARVYPAPPPYVERATPIVMGQRQQRRAEARAEAKRLDSLKRAIARMPKKNKGDSAESNATTA